MKALIYGILFGCLILTSCEGNQTNEDNVNTDIVKDTVAINAPSSPKPEAPLELMFKEFEEPNMFTIQYPEIFSEPTEKKHDNDDPYAGALSYWFAGPDGDVTFFVFPLYPKKESKFEGITIDETTEKLISETTVDEDGKSIEKVRIEAQDGSYIREYIKNDYVYVGMVFNNEETKEKYLKAFETFRTSPVNQTDS